MGEWARDSLVVSSRMNTPPVGLSWRHFDANKLIVNHLKHAIKPRPPLKGERGWAVLFLGLLGLEPQKVGLDTSQHHDFPIVDPGGAVIGKAEVML